jgi:hypothetical protein
MKKEDVIKRVNESAGSLFTKEDVINLINQVEGEASGIDLSELQDRIDAIIDDADTSDIEVNHHNCEFRVRNGNEIQIDEVDFDTDSFKSNIKHDIGELLESMQREGVEEEA